MKIASLDIDPQKGFTPLCPDELPVVDGHKIAEELLFNHSITDIHILTRDAHPTNAKWIAKNEAEFFKKIKGANLDIKWPSHCVIGTKGFELIDGLIEPFHYDFQVYKGIEIDAHPYGALYHDLQETQSTGLIEFLRYHNIKWVLCGGLALDYCVFSTINQLIKNQVKVILNFNATKLVDLNSKKNIIEQLNKLGVKIFYNRMEIENFITKLRDKDHELK